MDQSHQFSKDSEGLLASNSEDGELYVPIRHKTAHHTSIAAALTIFNAAILLATMIFWLLLHRYDGCVPCLAGASDVQDAIDAHVIEYDAVSRKAVIASNGDRNYVGLPSLETDAAWNDLLRGESHAHPLCPLPTRIQRGTDVS
jgi:hypothetical protein